MTDAATDDPKNLPVITAMQALDYEIRGSRWVPFTRWGPLRDVAAWHFTRVAKRKHGRYLWSKGWKAGRGNP